MKHLSSILRSSFERRFFRFMANRAISKVVEPSLPVCERVCVRVWYRCVYVCLCASDNDDDDDDDDCSHGRLNGPSNLQS